MGNTTTFNDPDTEAALLGKNVEPVYIIDPNTGKPYSTTASGLLTPWSSQPTTTAAAAADTVLKFGSAGTTPFAHISMQNNGTINFVYSYDADSTATGAKVYVLTPGQRVWEDRSASALHCHTASSVSFGGDTGITVEAFA